MVWKVRNLFQRHHQHPLDLSSSRRKSYLPPLRIIQILSSAPTSENIPVIVDTLQNLTWRAFQSVPPTPTSDNPRDAFAFDLDVIINSVSQCVLSESCEVSLAALNFIRQLLETRPLDFKRHVAALAPNLLELAHLNYQPSPSLGTRKALYTLEEETTPIAASTKPFVSHQLLSSVVEAEEAQQHRKSETLTDGRGLVAERTIEYALSDLKVLELFAITAERLKFARTGEIHEGLAELLADASERTFSPEQLCSKADFLILAIKQCALDHSENVRRSAVRLYMVLQKLAACEQRDQFEQSMPMDVRRSLAAGLRVVLTERKIGLDSRVFTSSGLNDFHLLRNPDDQHDLDSVVSAPATIWISPNVRTRGNSLMDDSMMQPRAVTANPLAAVGKTKKRSSLKFGTNTNLVSPPLMPMLFSGEEKDASFEKETWEELDRIFDSSKQKNEKVDAATTSSSLNIQAPIEKMVSRSRSDQGLSRFFESNSGGRSAGVGRKSKSTRSLFPLKVKLQNFIKSSINLKNRGSST